MPTGTRLHGLDRMVGVTVQSTMARALGIDVGVNLVDQLPEEGALVVHNQCSPLDPFVIALAIARLHESVPVVIIPDDHSDDSLLRGLLAGGALRVDRTISHDAVDLARTTDLVNHHVQVGRPVVLSAQGVRFSPSTCTQVDDELVHLGCDLGIPLVPTAVFGAQRRYDGASLRNRPAAVPAAVRFGPPVPGHHGLDRAATIAAVQADVGHLLDQVLERYNPAPDGPDAWWWPAGHDARHDAGPPPPNGDRPATAGTAERTAPDHHIPPGVPLPSPPVAHALDELRHDEQVLVDPEDVPDLPDLDAAEVLLPPPPPRRTSSLRPTGTITDEDVDGDLVSGVLSFTFPGKPMQAIRQAALQTIGEDQLHVVGRRSTAELGGVRTTKHHERTVYVGELLQDYALLSGGVQMTIPAGTRVAFLTVRSRAG